MADDLDDFFDSPKDKTSSNLALNSSSNLMPIVEVSNEYSIGDKSERSNTSNDEDNVSRSISHRNSLTEDENIDENQQETTSRHSKTGHFKHKTKNGFGGIAMTPPGKLLKKSEKKIKKYKQENKVKLVITEFIRITALSRIVYGDEHWKLAKSHVDLAQAYLELMSYPEQAHQHSEFARNIMMNSVAMVETSNNEDDKGNILETLLNIYYILGRSLTAKNRLNEAEQALNKAEKVAAKRAKIHSISDDDLDEWDIKIFLALARLKVKQQKQDDALEYYKKALEILEDIYDKDSIELISVYQGMGHVEMNKGRNANQEDMIDHFLQAHSITNANYDDDSVKSAETAHALATAYTCVGQEDAEISAESYLNDALKTYLSVYGPSHKKTINVQDDLAKIMIRTERHSEGIALLRKTIEPKTEVYGEFGNEVADTYKLIGNVYLATSEHEKAVKALRKCIAIQTITCGCRSKKVKDTQKLIDVLLANPQIAAKQKKSKADELKERPRFNSVVNRCSSINTKTIAY